MMKIIPSAILLATTIACMMPMTPAEAAGANRTFVSALGNDANPCSITQPCRTMQAAFNATAAGGTIDVLDPTGYGALVINKAVTIDGHGWAELNSPAGGNAVTISIGANDTVNLRGLTLVGGGTGVDGVLFMSGGSLHIQHSVARGFINGIRVTGVSSNVTISDTVASGNSFAGIKFAPSGSASLTIERVEVSGNPSSGFFVDGSSAPKAARIVAAFADCVAAGNNTGIDVVGSGFGVSGAPDVMIVNCKIVNNDTGINVSAATGWLAHSTLSYNGTGFVLQSGGGLNSFGNNFIRDTNNFGMLTPASQQ
jgi:nitrous oxidase accessory protein NosD